MRRVGGEAAGSWRFALLVFIILISGTVVAGDSLDTDRESLFSLKLSLEKQNPVNRGRYSEWNRTTSNPCYWYGISCSENGTRVIGVRLSESNISGEMFKSFSSLSQLQYLDLSKNTINGAIPDDLNGCHNLVYLNLSHNLLVGELNLSGLTKLETLDLSTNRIDGEIQFTFPAICDRLVVANLSENNFTGRIDNCFDGCQNLQYLDLSFNHFVGGLWTRFGRLVEFSVSQNNLTGSISESTLWENCSLQVLDLSENNFSGGISGNISNCKNLVVLNLWGNNFTGLIPAEIGSISTLEGLFLGSNNFNKVIPETLVNLHNLAFLDLSKNEFGGDIQAIFGRFTQVKFLVLHGNLYTGGINSSGILKLPNVSRLDLSYNNFSGPLPVEISQMPSLKLLILAYNQFGGSIPLEYGNMRQLQALDLSFNRLTGSIPPSFGRLSSLLWLMLANNSLTGEIPPEIGNCSSLLWVNLAYNQLSGGIPPQLTNIGKNAASTFLLNQKNNDRIIAGSGECLAMRRWIPADYPPFSFAYTILTRKSCRSIWDRLLKGVGVGLFPVCAAGSVVRTYQISGYLQLCGNKFSGVLPSDIGKMQNFSMLHLGFNDFYGQLPAQIGQLSLVVLNISSNYFSGQIPAEIANIKCLQNLDMSYNNFSGSFPESLGRLNDLSKFNISYNPFISGIIPKTGQFLTFEKDSYLGDPLLRLPEFIDKTTNNASDGEPHRKQRSRKLVLLLVFLFLTVVFVIFGVSSLIVCILVKTPEGPEGYLVGDFKYRRDLASSSSGSSPWLSDTVKIIRLDKTAFTHADILKATGNFSENRVIGKGGFGTVYKGVLPDGREVAVKKLQRQGTDGEKEFQAEMEVLSGNGFGWPHPNLVTLYGWCFDGLDKILVYEYMQGGSLEDLVTDRTKLTWRRRIEVAIDVANALVFLHHECYPSIVHRDVKASNVLLDKDGRARVTDFGLARVVDAGDSHVSTMVAGTVGYVAPEYGQTWQATTRGDVYSYGVLAMELATGRRTLDGGEECLVEWARRVMGNGRQDGSGRAVISVLLLGSGQTEGAEELCELLQIGVRCTVEAPHSRPNMKEVLAMLFKITCRREDFSYGVL
ncbi:hypothetical protein SLEP1_g3812 [Rubroshorea leprosula]|uniref:non-specific serine/threonine protein kinase n=1 Tax=Rubroshorea leprosula TaxID=152421 RepID=A0AAV5HR04_9ROSI|nr:hypothetical protein SLEP1_g3812 [Rubroshorea leprosula]